VSLSFPNQSTLKLSQISQHTTIQSTPTLFSPACTTQENGPPSLHMQSLSFPPPSRAPVHLVKNLHAGNSQDSRSCEQNLTHANATQTCRHGFQGWNTPVITTTNKQWLLPQQFTPKSQPRTRMKATMNEE
jgi:hypothetical protein